MKHTVLTDFLREKVDSFQVLHIESTKGRVTKTGDGVAHIKGLNGCRYGELLSFESGAVGMALELTENTVGAVLLQKEDLVRVNETVSRTGEVAKTPVGYELLGRVINPLGEPLDDLPLEASEYLPCEREAPAIIDRRPVDTPMMTGILAIDSMIPIGRGQRELIIGDRQTGKTAIAIDSIINQKDTGVLCIYCAIGQKASTVKGVIEQLKKEDALRYTVVVCAGASDAAALQYLAPYSAASVAERFAKDSKDVLIVYDDLSKHAVAYRTMSLLLRRPSGREAYPGDIFYLHSRLLERSAALSPEKGGGSITALPIVETMANNISAFIPTNIISITDGQIYLEEELFHAGVRPAVNSGLSVSRVGRAAQYPAMKEVSGTLRIELSQYRELEVFNRFGSEMSDEVKKQLNRGEALIELLKQPRSAPKSLFEQYCQLLMYELGFLEELPTEKQAEESARIYLAVTKALPALLTKVNATGKITPEEKEELIKVIKADRAEAAI